MKPYSPAAGGMCAGVDTRALAQMITLRNVANDNSMVMARKRRFIKTLQQDEALAALVPAPIRELMATLFDDAFHGALSRLISWTEEQAVSTDWQITVGMDVRKVSEQISQIGTVRDEKARNLCIQERERRTKKATEARKEKLYDPVEATLRHEFEGIRNALRSGILDRDIPRDLAAKIADRMVLS